MRVFLQGLRAPGCSRDDTRIPSRATLSPPRRGAAHRKPDGTYEAADPAQIERIRKALTETQAITVARRSVRTWDVCRRADLSTGVQSLFLSGLKTAIGVPGIMDGRDERYLVLQNSSGPAPFFAGPGLVLQFGSPGGASTVTRRLPWRDRRRCCGTRRTAPSTSPSC